MGLIVENLRINSVIAGTSSGGSSPPAALDWTSPTEEKVVAWDGSASSQFGAAVAVDADGDVQAVGSRYDLNTGTIYVRRWTGTEWLTAKVRPNNLSSSDQFGYSVALSGDGNTLAGGSPDHGASGSVTLYFWDGSAWTEQDQITAGVTNARFGQSVTLSQDGNVAIVGASSDSSGGGTTAGAVYVLTRSGTTWSAPTKLTPIEANQQAGAIFGYSVALSPDAMTLAVGAANEDAPLVNSGAAYVFVNSGGTWSQQARLVPDDPGGSDIFGNVVTISSDGNTVGVSGHGNDDVGSNSGSAYVFERDGTAWTQTQKLASDDLASGDNFGWAVGLSGGGDVLLVGAHLRTDNGLRTGAAYVFERLDGTFGQIAKLAPAGLDADDRFGVSIAMSGDGTTALVGAILDDDLGSNSGAVYVFDAA